ncbi:hypothetical protein BJ742DRAFT_468148 [Cladochytrium replicatum]|nr:hypothetical protein BJ742DRAFT_468148 [Cladochytrium replicatum]
MASTLSLPVIDLTPFLNGDYTSEAAVAECKKAAQALVEYGACAVRDPTLNEEVNTRFLDLMEDYFDQPTELKMKDVRPEHSYQVGATPELTEEPRCGRDETCLTLVEKMPEDEKPLDFHGKDPKWRYFWKINSNKPPANVVPEAFPQWESLMNEWGTKMHDAVSMFSQMLCAGLGLPKETITDLAKNGPHLLAPTASDLESWGTNETVLAGFHTDLNCITIHGKSRYPGLYIWGRNGKKLEVRIPDGCLLVQAGKQLEWLTGGHIEAGYHEVVVNEKTLAAVERQKALGRPAWRISSTFFFHIASDNILKPLPGYEPALPEKYPAVKTSDQVAAELGFIKLAA